MFEWCMRNGVATHNGNNRLIGETCREIRMATDPSPCLAVRNEIVELLLSDRLLPTRSST